MTWNRQLAEWLCAACLLSGFGFALLLAVPFRFRRFRLGGKRRLRLGRISIEPDLLPALIGAFLATFGASGLLLLAKGLATPLALAGGALIGMAASSLFVRVLIRFISESGREMEGQAIAGVVGHVALSIPPDGVGTVAYHADGRRATAPARSSDRLALPAGTRVLVMDIANGVAVVEAL
jgi:membrane protein implicated in regulation of membrane protease activity